MNDMNTFVEFPSLSRLSRRCIITEKLDGTNAQIVVVKPTAENPCDVVSHQQWKIVTEDSEGNPIAIAAGSRNRWITPGNDNFGFAKWVWDNAEELALGLGEGRHYGEWWGPGIQRGYGIKEKRFSLFNTIRWCRHDAEPQVISQDNPKAEVKYQTPLPKCCHLTPVLYDGVFCTDRVDDALAYLENHGSLASPGFMRPEGVVVFHVPSNKCFKKTLGGDGHKGGFKTS